tara:strand:+ start:1690 stop:2229 length:540 start_codon:yes stop_codon:yes gene_type:complete
MLKIPIYLKNHILKIQNKDKYPSVSEEAIMSKSTYEYDYEDADKVNKDLDIKTHNEIQQKLDKIGDEFKLLKEKMKYLRQKKKTYTEEQLNELIEIINKLEGDFKQANEVGNYYDYFFLIDEDILTEKQKEEKEIYLKMAKKLGEDIDTYMNKLKLYRGIQERIKIFNKKQKIKREYSK